MGRFVLPPERARRPPAERPPEHSMLDGLPSELLHIILEDLDVEDILSARLACKLLAQVGADYILEEVKVVYHRERFQRLVNLSNEPFFSKKVKSLYYQGNRFNPDDSYEEWDEHRRRPCRFRDRDPMNDVPDVDIVGDFNSKRSIRALQRALKANFKESKGHYSTAELERAFDAYEALVDDQLRIEEENLDLYCLTTLFTKCPKLDEVTISIGPGGRGTDAMTFAFAEALATPLGDVSHWDQGVRQLRTICEALQKSGKQLRAFTATDCSHTIIPEMGRDMALLKNMVRNLRSLRLGMKALTEDEDFAEAMLMAAVRRYESGDLREILRAATELRVLKLAFTMGPNLEFGASFEKTLHGLQFEKLKEFGVSQVVGTEDQFVDFLLQHKGTLKRLSISSCELEQGTWKSLFKRISGKLLKLRKLKLRGTFVTNNIGLVQPEEEFDFDIPGLEESKPDVLRDAVTKFIMEGGDWPDTSEVPLRCSDFWLEDPEYEPAGWLEDDGQDTDGSEISYGSDEFDAII